MTAIKPDQLEAERIRRAVYLESERARRAALEAHPDSDALKASRRRVLGVTPFPKAALRPCDARRVRV